MFMRLWGRGLIRADLLFFLWFMIDNGYAIIKCRKYVSDTVHHTNLTTLSCSCEWSKYRLEISRSYNITKNRRGTFYRMCTGHIYSEYNNPKKSLWHNISKIRSICSPSNYINNLRYKLPHASNRYKFSIDVIIWFKEITCYWSSF